MEQGGLERLYQDLVLRHSREPRNCRPIEGATHSASAVNATCGDAIAIHVTMKDGALADVAFEGEGCAISKASASMLTDAVLGLSPMEACSLASRLRAALEPDSSDALAEHGDLAAIAPVRGWPSRTRCALLAWEALIKALGKEPT